MKNIIIVLYKDCWGMSVLSVSDFFHIVSLLQKRIGEEVSYKITLASISPQKVKTASGIIIECDALLSNINKADLIIIPPVSGPNISDSSQEKSRIISWLKPHITRGTPIISLTTGVDLLLATEQFAKQTFASHWAFIPLLQKKYPNNNFISHQPYVFTGNIYSTGTLTGTFDALLAYIAQEKGDKFAQVCASHLLVAKPSKLSPFLYQYRNHTDSAIISVQDWLEDNYQLNANIEYLASMFGFSERNLKRRFTLATTLPPNKYLQKVRIDKAKKLLISTTMNIKEVAYQVGYENDSYFNRLFKTQTNMTMAQWRKSTKSI
jgi:transcriptional regulator GlxA family with amidase domain